MSSQTHATPEPAVLEDTRVRLLQLVDEREVGSVCYQFLVVEDQLKAARRSISDDKGIRWLDPPTRRGEVPPEIRQRLLGAVKAPSWVAFAAEWGDAS